MIHKSNSVHSHKLFIDILSHSSNKFDMSAKTQATRWGQKTGRWLPLVKKATKYQTR